MFIRSRAKQNKTVSELEMTELKLRCNLKINPIIPKLVPLTFNTMKIKSLLSVELNVGKIRKKYYMNAAAENETRSHLSYIINDIWREIFSHLDIRTLTFMIFSCKKMANLANDDRTRRRLYNEKQKLFFKRLLPKPTPKDILYATPKFTELHSLLRGL